MSIDAVSELIVERGDRNGDDLKSTAFVGRTVVGVDLNDVVARSVITKRRVINKNVVTLLFDAVQLAKVGLRNGRRGEDVAFG